MHQAVHAQMSGGVALHQAMHGSTSGEGEAASVCVGVHRAMHGALDGEGGGSGWKGVNRAMHAGIARGARETTAEVAIKFLNPGMVKPRLSVGARFKLWEAGDFADGEILEGPQK